MSIDAPLYALTYGSYESKPYSWNIFQHAGKLFPSNKKLKNIKYKKFYSIEMNVNGVEYQEDKPVIK